MTKWFLDAGYGGNRAALWRNIGFSDLGPREGPPPNGPQFIIMHSSDLAKILQDHLTWGGHAYKSIEEAVARYGDADSTAVVFISGDPDVWKGLGEDPLRLPEPTGKTLHVHKRSVEPNDSAFAARVGRVADAWLDRRDLDWRKLVEDWRTEAIDCLVAMRLHLAEQPNLAPGELTKIVCGDRPCPLIGAEREAGWRDLKPDSSMEGVKKALDDVESCLQDGGGAARTNLTNALETTLEDLARLGEVPQG